MGATRLGGARRTRHSLAGGVIVLSLAQHAGAGQLTATVELQAAGYPRSPVGRQAIASEMRGWASIEYERRLEHGFGVEGDVLVYGSNRRRAVVDAAAAVGWRSSRGSVSVGLLRERWGRVAEPVVDELGASNTPFSLVHPEARLSQPTVRATKYIGSVAVEGSLLVGQRRQPLPEADQRFGLGMNVDDVVRRGRLGDQALAVRVSGTGGAVDWSAHAFTGTNRRPTFVPRLDARGRLTAVHALYTDIVQVGGDVEATHADWRLLAEGLVRRGGVDVTGREATYGIAAAAAEYQRLGAVGGAYDVIPRIDVTLDTRGDRTDIPFASSLRGGVRVAQTRRLPVQVEAGYSFDWTLRGHGLVASVEKVLAESPAISIGTRVTAFSGGRAPGILDLWRDDLEVYGFLRIGVSR
jgi:hypothetical protein